jgi:asparagine synthase (glutamine-hydrolysing)
MCGVVGILNLAGTSADAAPLERMVAMLGHRGPDASGVWADGPVAFGHTRLSIIDLEGGVQPMGNPSGSLRVTFNGEIFNYVELREELRAQGHHFATQSDTEVILHQYEEKGDDCVHDFNGQWAFAIWDTRRRRLLLSRDRIGIRPLYYTVADGQLLFASEMKALLVHPSVRRELDAYALDEVFTFWCTRPPRTIFRGILELPPGHLLVVEDGRIDVRRYWQLDYSDVPEVADEAECADRLRELLIDATRLRLRSDVPVGAYVSGGLDSAVIAALVRNFTDNRLKTFSVVFEDREFDESEFQREVSELLQTEHHETLCTGENIGQAFPEVVWHAETPIVRTAPAPLYLLSGLVREHDFKVVLTGEGADEVLGGYDIFKEAKIRRFWGAFPESNLRPLLLKRLYPYLKNIQSQPEAYRRAFFHVRPEDLSSPFFSHLPRWDMTATLRRFYSAELKAETAAHDLYEEASATLPDHFWNWEPFARAQYLEATILLPGYILSSQADRMAMGHSVEGRFPFLDHRVIEFAGSLPSRLKMKVLDEKYILKRAAGDIVPTSVIRRTKQPYRAPEASSLLGDAQGRGRPEWTDDMLSAARVKKDGLFDPLATDKLLRKFKKGRAIGVRDNMALVGIASSQLLVDRFINNFRN